MTPINGRLLLYPDEHERSKDDSDERERLEFYNSDFAIENDRLMRLSLRACATFSEGGAE